MIKFYLHNIDQYDRKKKLIFYVHKIQLNKNDVNKDLIFPEITNRGNT